MVDEVSGEMINKMLTIFWIPVYLTIVRQGIKDSITTYLKFFLKLLGITYDISLKTKGLQLSYHFREE